MARHSELVLTCLFVVLTTGLPCRVAGRIVGDPKSAPKLSFTAKNSSGMEGVGTAHGNSERMVRGCTSGNPIDDCWRCDPQWRQNRQALANCAVGAGRNAIGGRDGSLYVVTDPSDADTTNPVPGTLRYGAVQPNPLWITFSRDMTIRLRNELILTSYKTVDGRGCTVHIAGGAGITLQSISHVILHSVHFHDIISTGPGDVRSSTTHSGHRKRTDGDAVNVYSSRDVWVDHCYFAKAADGLVDVTRGSTSVTISNNYFTQHDKVILLGAHPGDAAIDRAMRVTVSFNHFGPNLIERLPRIRHGSVHVMNNFYDGWKMYAIGGSESPTVVSQGNFFIAPNGVNKEVSKRLEGEGDAAAARGRWNWVSTGDEFRNGAFFSASGAPLGSQVYSTAMSDAAALPAAMVAAITADAGPLACSTSAGFC